MIEHNPAYTALPTPMDRAEASWDAARKLEAAFLAEMLKSTGYGENDSAFSGGQGEAQFASFLREQQASAMVEAGGIGLAEMFFQSLTERDE